MINTSHMATTEEIHTAILHSGAMTSQTGDGLVHHIIRRGTAYADMECASDGSCTLQIKIGEEFHSAEGNNARKMAQLWQKWCAHGLAEAA
ncbi:MAG TPA: hypothetical protein VKQ72_06075 [Aggregatilineales bacterium]|nr:hypothetical protein [Aggregatilineales bacterium]